MQIPVVNTCRLINKHWGEWEVLWERQYCLASLIEMHFNWVIFVYIYIYIYIYIYSHSHVRCYDSSQDYNMSCSLVRWRLLLSLTDCRIWTPDPDIKRARYSSGLCNALLSLSDCIFAVHTTQTSLKWCHIPQTWVFFCDFKMVYLTGISG